MKRPYKKTAASVVKAFRAHPEWNSVQIGQALGLHPAYVRVALRRSGIRIARQKPQPLSAAA